MLDPVSSQLAAEKQALRESLRAVRAETAPRAGSAAALAAGQAAALLLVPRLSGAAHVALYLAFGHEFDPAPIGEALRQRGASLYYPRVSGARGLSFHAVPDPSRLRPGAFGVSQPDADAPLAPRLDVLLIPGLGFDRQGHRLGYGRGHYDTALRGCPSALRVALGYPFQIVPTIPHDGRDEPVDLLVTPEALHDTLARPLSHGLRAGWPGQGPPAGPVAKED